MNWELAIERNRDALKRLVALLVAMAGWDMRGPSTFFHPASVSEPEMARSAICRLAHGLRPTLPRHLHRALLGLLRPAESALRRLVIVAARGLVVPPPRPRPPEPLPKSAILRGRIGTGLYLPRACRAAQMAARAALRGTLPPRPLTLPMLDPARRLLRPRPHTPAHRAPSICVPGVTERHIRPVRHEPLPDDRLDAMRIVLRLDALGRALDDIPARALRFARWLARRDAHLLRQREAYQAAIAEGRDPHASPTPARRDPFRNRFWPLRAGRPPGSRRRSRHEAHALLRELHTLALDVLDPPDTS